MTFSGILIENWHECKAKNNMKIIITSDVDHMDGNGFTDSYANTSLLLRFSHLAYVNSVFSH